MKKPVFIIILFLLIFSAGQVSAAVTDTIKTEAVKLYDPTANAEAGIKAAVMQAKKEGKHVLIQAGGNWCVWCLRFNKFTTEDKQMDSAMKAGYIVYHLNWSPENKNSETFSKYGFAQRFGFPVFIILDEAGNRLHTQNSSYLEQGNGYNKTKVLDFLHDWSPVALNPANYKNL